MIINKLKKALKFHVSKENPEQAHLGRNIDDGIHGYFFKMEQYGKRSTLYVKIQYNNSSPVKLPNMLSVLNSMFFNVDHMVMTPYDITKYVDYIKIKRYSKSKTKYIIHISEPYITGGAYWVFFNDSYDKKYIQKLMATIAKHN